MHAQNWLKIKTSYLFLNFDLAKRGSSSPLATPCLRPWWRYSDD